MYGKLEVDKYIELRIKPMRLSQAEWTKNHFDIVRNDSNHPFSTEKSIKSI